MQTMRIVLVGSVGLLVTAVVLSGQAAPTPGDASVTVDKQIHLGTDSALVKEGNLLLWEASNNTGIGRSALSSNTSGNSNTAVGSLALSSNTSGWFNTAVGNIALQDNYDGQRNTAVGGFALANNVAGSYNTAIGLAAMEYNTSGNYNTALGIGALGANIGESSPYSGEGSANTAVGASALASNQYGFNNTAIGHTAMQGATDGNWNTAVGSRALLSNSGSYNTAVGSAAMPYNLTGRENTAVGLDALFQGYSGNNNVALGAGALYNNSSGSNNIAVGHSAGSDLQYEPPPPAPVTTTSTYSHNILIGNQGMRYDEHTIRIGSPFVAATSGQDRTFIAGIATATGDTFSVHVCVDPTSDQLGPCPLPDSSRRFKEEIQDIGGVSEKLMQLRPVRFRFKEEHARSDRSVQYGLIAEEVAAVFPELVIYGDDGAPRSVKYHLLSSLLLNELQKQEQRLAAQSREMVGLKAVVSELEEVKARLARLETSPASPLLAPNRVAERARSSPTQVTPNRE